MTLRQIVLLVMLLNLAYFFVEFSIGLKIGSVSLFADSIDFLEDAIVNFLILIAIGWSTEHRARVGMLLAGVLLIPGLATIWTAFSKFQAHLTPSPFTLTLTGLGALGINFTCATMLTQFRKHESSLMRAAFLSARNDVLANIAIIAAGCLTFYFPTIWPDLIVGLGIAAMNLDAAKEVWETAKKEHKSELK